MSNYTYILFKGTDKEFKANSFSEIVKHFNINFQSLELRMINPDNTLEEAINDIVNGKEEKVAKEIDYKKRNTYNNILKKLDIDTPDSYRENDEEYQKNKTIIYKTVMNNTLLNLYYLRETKLWKNDIEKVKDMVKYVYLDRIINTFNFYDIFLIVLNKNDYKIGNDDYIDGTISFLKNCSMFDDCYKNIYITIIGDIYNELFKNREKRIKYFEYDEKEDKYKTLLTLEDVNTFIANKIMHYNSDIFTDI